MSTLRPVAAFAAVIVFAGSLMAEQIRIKREEVPEPVLNTVEKLFPGNTYGAARKLIDEDGRSGVVYQVDVSKDGHGLRFRVLPDGKFVESMDMSQKLAETPDAVRKTIERAC